MTRFLLLVLCLCFVTSIAFGDDVPTSTFKPKSAIDDNLEIYGFASRDIVAIWDLVKPTPTPTQTSKPMPTKPKPTLDGAWELCGVAHQSAITIWDITNKDVVTSRMQLLFRGEKVVWLNDEENYMGIPLNGSEFDIKIDRTKTPHRLVVTFEEGGQRVDFAYCIFQRVGDKLLLKTLFALALGSNGDEEDFERFAKNPYPHDLKLPQTNKIEQLMLFQKTKDVIPIPNPEDQPRLPIPKPQNKQGEVENETDPTEPPSGDSSE